MILPRLEIAVYKPASREEKKCFTSKISIEKKREIPKMEKMTGILKR